MWDDERIDAYLMDRLDASTRAEFEAELGRNPQLREAVALRRDIRAGIQAQARDEIKAHLDQLEAQAQPPARKLRPLWMGAIAAGLALLLLIGLWPTSQPTTRELLAEYLVPHPNYVGGGVRGDPTLANLRTGAMAAYDERRWKQAESLMGQYLASQPADEEIRFYLGVAQLADQQYQAAQASFQATLSGQAVDYHEAARWYLALSYIGSGNQQAARLLLREIAEGSSSYASNAKELLKVV